MEPKLCTVLLERASAIIRMNRCVLPLKLLRDYPIPSLLSYCDRKQESLPGISITDPALQRELIENPAFAAYYAKLLPLFPEEEPAEPEPACRPCSGRNYHPQSSRPAPPSRRASLMAALYGLVEACQSHEKDITAYPQEQVMDILMEDALDPYTRLVFLENFAAAELPEDTRRTVVANLHRCIAVPLELTERQKALLVEPYVMTRPLFQTAPLEEIVTLLDSCPVLLDIIRLLHEGMIYEELTLADYAVIAQDAAEHHRLLESLIALIGHDAAGMFMRFWKRDRCPLQELRAIASQAGQDPGADWEARLSTHAGYVNQLYGSRFKAIDLADVSEYQENILIYAIVHNKKHFIKLVDANAERFLSLLSGSVLFQERLYREHFNLNELTEKDLEDCAWMAAQKLPAESLAPGRRYTFQELRTLYGTSRRYILFYNLLQSESQDYRLRVFRQIHKRSLVPFTMDEGDVRGLAARLDNQPLDRWMQADFGHITGLTAADAVQMLVHLDKLRPVLSDIRTRTDALLALRCVDGIGAAMSIAELKASLLRTDTCWQSLAEHMKLTPEFLERCRENITGFLCRNGAYIAETYRLGLGAEQQEAFLRVVKAELMGQLDTLKYFEGDLQRELDSPLTARVRSGWKENLSLERDGLEVREHDDFFSTMLLGTQPQRTCLSYENGAYRQCLLSAFDSNKKVLYAVVDGRVAGRAFLRLTKGRLTGADAPAAFTFVDLEHINASRAGQTQESLTLFLERPYIAGVGPEVSQNIMRMFVELAERKAGELGTMLVLSGDYRGMDISGYTWTRYAIYISKSKAGAQYLDSLGGQATVDTEGSYESSNFLVRSNNQAGIHPEEIRRAS